MIRGFSLWLDALRALAALTVLAGHMAHIRFTGGEFYFLREINIASDAVIVFFVLSGVVIAYAAGRDDDFGTFTFNRLTRLLSVMIPALVLTVVFDSIGTRIDMEAYPEGYYHPLPIWEMALRGLTFTNEWQGQTDRLRLGSNGPLWSLSYEFAYYTLFAVAVFLRGLTRAVLLGLLCALIGLPILALLPAWALGVWVWHRVSADGYKPPHYAAAILMAFGAPLALALCRYSNLPELLETITYASLLPFNHHTLLGYSNEVLWNTLIALATALHLIGAHALAARMRQRRISRISKGVRWMAGGSFSLYVTHYPTMQLLDAMLPDTSWQSQLFLLFGTLIVAALFAAIFERPLAFWRICALQMLRRSNLVAPN
ncbi:acyltransferase [Gymnodinialimonas sp. 2305UL16-5]|uniref:acyltransferase family protein n=1 Tax=Gymnodinialimonas mytili TaxID=3126503 RepID=UPI0030A734B5